MFDLRFLSHILLYKQIFDRFATFATQSLRERIKFSVTNTVLTENVCSLAGA